MIAKDSSSFGEKKESWLFFQETPAGPSTCSMQSDTEKAVYHKQTLEMKLFNVTDVLLATLSQVGDCLRESVAPSPPSVE